MSVMCVAKHVSKHAFFNISIFNIHFFIEIVLLGVLLLFTGIYSVKL